MADVAVLGMGRMGAAMAATLAGAGLDVVVWNRTQSTAEEVAERIGGAAVATPREAVSAAPVVVSSLADDAAVTAVYAGEDGLVAGVTGGVIVLETSTIDPETVHRIADDVKSAGGLLFDAPVSGSVSLVEKGELTIMVGGPQDAVGPARAVLDALAARVFHVGDVGAGATMKLAVNAVVHAINMTVSEALVLAEAAGVDRETAYDVFAAGAGGAPFVQYNRAAFLDPENAPVAFSLDLVAKDLELITGLAQRVGVPVRQARTNLEVAQSAIAAGFGEQDMSAVAQHLRRG